MYSSTIKLAALGVAQSLSANTEIIIYDPPLPNKIYLGDWGTHYVGYYTDNGKVAHLTGIKGSGTPYQMLFGFGESSLGLIVTVNDKKYVVSRLYTNKTLVNLDDSVIENHNGIEISRGRLHGTNVYYISVEFNGKLYTETLSIIVE